MSENLKSTCKRIKFVIYMVLWIILWALITLVFIEAKQQVISDDIIDVWAIGFIGTFLLVGLFIIPPYYPVLRPKRVYLFFALFFLGILIADGVDFLIFCIELFK